MFKKAFSGFGCFASSVAKNLGYILLVAVIVLSLWYVIRLFWRDVSAGSPPVNQVSNCHCGTPGIVEHRRSAPVNAGSTPVYNPPVNQGPTYYNPPAYYFNPTPPAMYYSNPYSPAVYYNNPVPPTAYYPNPAPPVTYYPNPTPPTATYSNPTPPVVVYSNPTPPVVYYNNPAPAPVYYNNPSATYYTPPGIQTTPSGGPYYAAPGIQTAPSNAPNVQTVPSSGSTAPYVQTVPGVSGR